MIIHSLQQERNVYLRSQKCVSIFSNDSVFKFCLLRCYNNTYNEYNIYIYINVQTICHMILWEVGLYDSLPISVEFARCRWTGVDCLPELHKWAACRPCFFFRDRGTDQLGYWWAHPKKSFLPFHSCYFGVWQISTLEVILRSVSHQHCCWVMWGRGWPGCGCSHVMFERALIGTWYSSGQGFQHFRAKEIGFVDKLIAWPLSHVPFGRDSLKMSFVSSALRPCLAGQEERLRKVRMLWTSHMWNELCGIAWACQIWNTTIMQSKPSIPSVACTIDIDDHSRILYYGFWLNGYGKEVPMDM